MGQPEIVQKLTDLLLVKLDTLEEAHVIYLMVEMRKILDHDAAASKFPLLKFYADWAIHTRKDYISPEVAKIAEAILRSASSAIARGPVSDDSAQNPILNFAEMNDLRAEVDAFLKSYGIPSNLATSNERWRDFVSQLVLVLGGQPVLKPCLGIAEIRFEPATRGSAVAVIELDPQINGRAQYTFTITY